MIADSLSELHELAAAIGLKRAWFQKDASFPHYDLSKVKRKMAIKRGAKEVTRKELVVIMQSIRKMTPRP